MSAQYLIRFDDICPTMNWEIWNRIETVLNENSIKPIIAVIPDNQDKSFFIDEATESFWQCVKKWQKNGWTIALHGYQHLYLTKESGVLCLNKQSEFAGVEEKHQYDALVKALRIFKENNITPDIWVAPSHSFDLITLNILKQLGLTAISDGLSFRPFLYHSMLWIPQQIWKFHTFPFGLWTVCFHHNTWTHDKLDRFIGDIKKYNTYITSFENVRETTIVRKRNLADIIFHFVFCGRMKVKKIIRERNRC